MADKTQIKGLESGRGAISIHRESFDPESEPASDAVDRIVGEVTDHGSRDHESIDSVVDPLVFDAFLRRSRRDFQLSFVYNDHNVTVGAGGDITVRPALTDGGTGRSFSFDVDESPSHAVVRAIETVKDVDAMDMAPLSEYVDGDALDAIIDSPEQTDSDDIAVSFQMEGLRIRVTSDCEIVVRPIQTAE